MAEGTVRNENTYTYTTIPRALMGKGLTSSACVLGGFFNSYGSTVNGSSHIAACTYSRAKDELRIPSATFSRAVSSLLHSGTVKRVKRSGYSYQESAAEGFDVLPDWVRTNTFDIKTKKLDANGERVYISRRLTYSEMLVFAAIFTRLANEKNRRAKYSVSHSEIAAETNLSRRTVYAAVQVLLGAGLFHQEKGGGSKKNAYILNLKRYRLLGGTRKRHAATSQTKKDVTVIHKLQTQVEKEKAADAQRKRYAAALSRQIAAEEQEHNYRICIQDAAFARSDKEISMLAFEIALAEVQQRPLEEIDGLNHRYSTAYKARSDALKRLKMRESDLPPDRRRPENV